MKTLSLSPVRTFPIADRWTLHSYYTLCPYAPDGSGRILAAGADLDTGLGEVLVLDPEGRVLDRFGSAPVEGGFYHTGRWQTWSPDAQYVYFQSGSLRTPGIIRRHLASGREVAVEGDMEGAPPFGEPVYSGLMGMLYAAGYGDGLYKPQAAPIPFQERKRHGIFEQRFSPRESTLRLNIEELLDACPDRDRILQADKEIKERLGSQEGLTLMAYCVRWNHDGSRCLFYFGNHCVVPSRGEPKLSYVMTAKSDFTDIRLALNLSFGRRGVHWSWQPDNEHLIGYGFRPDDPGRGCLAEVRYDGADYRILSDHASGGHPSVSPADGDLIVTDESTGSAGAVLFISRGTGREIGRIALPKFIGDREPPGRNPLRICHHPVFSRDGSRVLFNTLPGRNAVLGEVLVNP